MLSPTSSIHTSPAAQRRSVLILGSGFSASLSAMVLAAEGFEVTLLEPGKRTGGLAGSYFRNGFRVDIGAPLFSRQKTGAIEHAFTRVNTPLPYAYGRLAPHKIRGGRFYLHIPQSPLVRPLTWFSLANQAHMGPRGWIRLGNFIGAASRINRPSSEFLHAQRRPAFGDHRRDPTLARFAAALGAVLDNQPSDPVSERKNLESMYSFFAADFVYPLGGLEAIAGAMLSEARRLGATVQTRRTIQEWIFEGDRLVGAVDDAKGIHRVDLVLAPEIAALRPLPQTRKMIQIKWGVRRPVLRAGVLVGFGTPQAGARRRLGNKALPYVCISPSHADKDAAPKGRQLLSAWIYGPSHAEWTDAPKTLSYNAEKDLTLLLTQILRKHLPGIDAETIFIDKLGARYLETIEEPGLMRSLQDKRLLALRGSQLGELPAMNPCGYGPSTAAEKTLTMLDTLALKRTSQAHAAPAPPLEATIRSRFSRD